MDAVAKGITIKHAMTGINPKNGKFTESVEERQHWNKYMQAFKEAIKSTSTR
jgi:polyphosphate kinase 2 (PPK2 family)